MLLLNYLERLLGGAKAFELFLKFYITQYSFKSITTNDWKACPYDYFIDKKRRN